MKALIALLLTLAVVRAGTARLVWDYDPPLPAYFEVDVCSRPEWVWRPAGVAFTDEISLTLPDGVYQARVVAVPVEGSRSLYSEWCFFRVPYVLPPPPATHVRLRVWDPAGGVVVGFDDPIIPAAFYRIDPDCARVCRSVDLVTWSPVGSVVPAGKYFLNSELITLRK